MPPKGGFLLGKWLELVSMNRERELRVESQIRAQGQMTVASAVAVLDLLRSGVTDELAEVPFRWWEEPKATGGDAPAPAVARVEEAPSVRRAEAPRLEIPAKVERPVVQAPVVPVDQGPDSKVWVAGEAGGVVLVVRAGLDLDGQVPVAGKGLALIQRMLTAVDMQALPLGWAVVGCSVDTVQLALQAQLQQAVAGLEPRYVLVLGQVAVGTLAGQSLGVEGWQAAPRALVPGWQGALGVTYPPELLLARPLFKRLTWQHLQKWQIEAGYE